MFYCVFYLQFYENHFWNVASAGLRFTANSVATEINFAKPTATEIDAFYDYRNSQYVTFY